jgi:predicted AAA+ superfamily ATPase
MARAKASQHPDGAILVIDEIQKIQNWSERIKRLWDEDSIQGKSLKVVLLGSSSLLLHRGLTESMAGRFEIISIAHWSFSECQKAFGVSLDEYLYFGGYPGALTYLKDEDRFLAYIQDAIIEPVITRDILSQSIIHKPALLRELFLLGCQYSGQILSFNKMLGQMQDAGNTTTLSHYLNLLKQAGVLCGLDKFASQKVRQRQSSPKLQVYNTALMTGSNYQQFNAAMQNPQYKGRLIESAVGATLLMDAKSQVHYWRENNQEVDFIVTSKNKLFAIELKSTSTSAKIKGMQTFAKNFNPDCQLLVGSDGTPLEVFLKTPLLDFL